jgi:hypothetical protein
LEKSKENTEVVEVVAIFPGGYRGDGVSICLFAFGGLCEFTQ